MICGWCQGSGEKDGKSCVCRKANRGYFPGKGKAKKKDDGYAFKQAHKCGPEVQEFLYEKGSVSYYLCECGKMVKVTAE